MTPLGQAAGRKNLAKFLGIDMRAGSTGGLMMVMVVMMVVMMVMMVMMMVMVAPPLLRRQRRDLSVGWSQPPAPRISGCTVYHFKNFYCSRLKNLYFPQKNIGFWDAATSQS